MIELNKHILKLLSENDIAIIPHFGGFLAHYIPAIRDSKNNLFIPPKRSIGFNEQLKLNDGLLAQSYMERHAIGFQEADSQIKEAIQSLKENLQENGYFKLEGLGTIYCDSNGQYSFEELKDADACPLFFGLNSFEMYELSQLKQNQQQPKTDHKHIKQTQKHTSHDLIGAVAILCVIISSVFLFSSPTEQTINFQSDNYANILPLKVWDIKTENEQVLNIEEETKDTVNSNQAVTLSEDNNLKKTEPKSQNGLTQNTVPTTSNNNKYHIIVASLIPIEKAQILVEELHQKGYNTARILQNSGKRRVCINSFTTKEEAQKALISSIHANYPNAWILKNK